MSAQEPLAVEERPAVDPVADPSPPSPGQSESGPHAESVGGGIPLGAPEQRASGIIVPTYSEREAALRAPFTKEAVKWRVLRGTQVIAYVDVRVVIERLNLVVPGLWSEGHDALPNGALLCRLTVDGQTHEDVGTGKDPKAAWSDSLKRAAVRFGVGVSVYAIPSRNMDPAGEFGKPRMVEDYDGKEIHTGPYVERKGSGIDLTADGHWGMRLFYHRWLEKTGIERFGEPIDHGDVAESAGEFVAPEDEAEVTDLPAVKLPLTDEKADLLRATCRKIYEQVDKRKLPKGRFESELGQASVSHAELEAFAAKLREMAQ